MIFHSCCNHHLDVCPNSYRHCILNRCFPIARWSLNFPNTIQNNWDCCLTNQRYGRCHLRRWLFHMSSQDRSYLRYNDKKNLRHLGRIVESLLDSHTRNSCHRGRRRCWARSLMRYTCIPRWRCNRALRRCTLRRLAHNVVRHCRTPRSCR